MGSVCDISEVLLNLGLEGTVSEVERTMAAVALQAATDAVSTYLNYNPVKAERTEYYPVEDFRRSGSMGVWQVSDTQAYVRQLSQYVTNELQLSHLPIRSIANLWIDYDGRFGTRTGSFQAEHLMQEGVDFWAQYEKVDSTGGRVCSDGILRSQGRWPDAPGSVKVQYTAGYTDAELRGQDAIVNAHQINEAVRDEAVRRFMKDYSRRKKKLAGFVGPLTSESLGSYNYSVDTAVMDRMIGGTMDLLPETQQKLQKFQRYDCGVE